MGSELSRRREFATEWSMKKWWPFWGILVGVFLAGCVLQEPTPPEATYPARRSAAFAEAPRDRPGLGTKWGETRISRAEATTFERADLDHPLAAAGIYYNTAEGIRAMSGIVAWERSAAILPAPAGELVTIELCDQSGRLLPGLIIGDRCLLSARKADDIPSWFGIGAIFGSRSFCPSMVWMLSMEDRPHFENAATSLILVNALS